MLPQMMLVRASDVLGWSKLQKCEDLRDAGRLKVLDHPGDLERFKADGNHVVFFSHQWLAFSEPDPMGVHFDAICEAVRNTAAHLYNGDIESLYCWAS